MANPEDRITKLGDTAPPTQAAVAPETEAKLIEGANHDAELSGRKFRVTFFSQEVDGGQDAIFASLNFYAYQIPRDVPVDIPYELLQVFEDANTRIINTNTKGGTTERNVKRFNYSVHGEVAPKKQNRKAA